jgi:molecular chaperone GrpE
MLQRTIFRQRRAVASTLSRSAFPPSSALRQTSPFQQLSLKQSSFKTVPRYYSTENGAKKEDAKENGEAANKEAESPEESLKKELEAKNKEVVDLKVISEN